MFGVDCCEFERSRQDTTDIDHYEKREEMTTGVQFSQGHGMVLLKHELVGVNLKEEGRAPHFCIFRIPCLEVCKRVWPRVERG